MSKLTIFLRTIRLDIGISRRLVIMDLKNQHQTTFYSFSTFLWFCHFWQSLTDERRTLDHSRPQDFRMLLLRKELFISLQRFHWFPHLTKHRVRRWHFIGGSQRRTSFTHWQHISFILLRFGKPFVAACFCIISGYLKGNGESESTAPFAFQCRLLVLLLDWHCS